MVVDLKEMRGFRFVEHFESLGRFSHVFLGDFLMHQTTTPKDDQSSPEIIANSMRSLYGVVASLQCMSFAPLTRVRR